MRNRDIIALAVALVITCLIFYPFFTGDSDRQGKCLFISMSTFRHATLSYVPHLLLVAAKIHFPNHFYSDENSRRKKSRNDDSGSKISVFKGREASLNRAIFAILAKEGPKTIIELQRQLNKQKGLQGTYYASVNKRIHCLEKSGYVTPLQTETPQPTSRATLYDLRPKAYLAIFMNKKGPEEVLNEITDKDATIILSDLIQACLPNNKE